MSRLGIPLGILMVVAAAAPAVWAQGIVIPPDREKDLYGLEVVESAVLREYTGADIAITRAFRYGYPILPGKVTMDDLYNIMPVNPKVRVGTIRGEQYRARMEDLLERVFSADPFKQSGWTSSGSISSSTRPCARRSRTASWRRTSRRGSGPCSTGPAHERGLQRGTSMSVALEDRYFLAYSLPIYQHSF